MVCGFQLGSVFEDFGFVAHRLWRFCGFWFESLILGILVADGYKVLGLCTDADAVVLSMHVVAVEA